MAYAALIELNPDMRLSPSWARWTRRAAWLYCNVADVEKAGNTFFVGDARNDCIAGDAAIATIAHNNSDPSKAAVPAIALNDGIAGNAWDLGGTWLWTGTYDRTAMREDLNPLSATRLRTE